MGRISQHHGAGGEAGYTIVEVMVGMVMLVVGVLAMLVMVEGSLSSTSRTTAREQATNLAREIVERSRQVPYASTTTSAAPVALAGALPESPAASGTDFALTRRQVQYAVTVYACSIDDPSDGAGVGNATFCDPPPNPGPQNPQIGPGLAIGPNVLGVPVTLAAGGSLVNTVCDAVGTDTAIANQVSSLSTSLLGAQGKGAVISICPGGGGGSVAYDPAPDDLRRIRVIVRWTRNNGQPSSLTQVTLLTSPSS